MGCDECARDIAHRIGCLVPALRIPVPGDFEDSRDVIRLTYGKNLRDFGKLKLHTAEAKSSTSFIIPKIAQNTMSSKRKRDDKQGATSDVVAKPAAGTRVFVSGKAVKEGLGAGNRQCELCSALRSDVS